MTGALSDLLSVWNNQLATFGLVLLRIGAIMALLPAFGERSVPARVRLALALAFSALVAPIIEPPTISSFDEVVLVSTAEVLVGLAFGIVLRLFVLVLQVSGTIAANVTSLAQVFGGSTVDPQPAISHLMVVAGLALAAIAGLHVKITAALISSYDILPLGLPPSPEKLAEWGTSHVARTFALAFSLSAPFLVISVVYNLALGAINRAMPQLMVAFVGAPAITGASLLLVLVSTPILLGLWLSAFDEVLSKPGVF